MDIETLFTELGNVIPKGKENAIHLDDLCGLMNAPATKIKFKIRKARQNGFIICSGKNGYWIPTDEEEVRHWKRLMQKQAYTRLKCVRGITRAPMPNQLSIFDIEDLKGGVE